jgi:hypothetical protein
VLIVVDVYFVIEYLWKLLNTFLYESTFGYIMLFSLLMVENLSSETEQQKLFHKRMKESVSFYLRNRFNVDNSYKHLHNVCMCIYTCTHKYNIGVCACVLRATTVNSLLFTSEYFITSSRLLSSL